MVAFSLSEEVRKMQSLKTIHDIILPRLSDQDEESLIVFWHKTVGDAVQKGEVILEVQTEKAVTEIEADLSGVIVKLHKKRGEVVRTGEVLVSMEAAGGEKKESAQNVVFDDQSLSAVDEKQLSKPFVKASPRVRKLAKDLGIDLTTITGTGKNGEPTVQDVENAAKAAVEIIQIPDSNSENSAKGQEPAIVQGSKIKVIAPPSVRKLARELGVNLEELGINGKIQREDILKAAAEKEQNQKEEPIAGINSKTERVKLAGIRKAIAKAMTHSKKTIPHVTHFAEAHVTELVAHREKYKEVAKSKNIKLTYLPYVVMALISTLKEYKELNASIDEKEEFILYKKFYHIGIAVQTDNGLVVPVIKNADQLKITSLAKEIDELTKTARENKLSKEQMQDGTCTISNIGSAGGQWFTPVINHPETAILGIGVIVEKPVVRNGEIVIGKTLPLSLSYDHRVIDGVIAQNALNHIKKLLQDPELLLLDLN